MFRYFFAALFLTLFSAPEAFAEDPNPYGAGELKATSELVSVHCGLHLKNSKVVDNLDILRRQNPTRFRAGYAAEMKKMKPMISKYGVDAFCKSIRKHGGYH